MFPPVSFSIPASVKNDGFVKSRQSVGFLKNRRMYDSVNNSGLKAGGSWNLKCFHKRVAVKKYQAGEAVALSPGRKN